MRRIVRLAAVALFFTFLTALSAVVMPREAASAALDCLACHGDTSFATIDSTGARHSLYVNASLLAGSIHAGFSCQDCHAGIDSVPHPSPLPLVACESCHTDAAAAYTDHGGATESPGHYFPACWNCHGTHDILPASDSHSWVAPANLTRTCGRCHENPAIVGRFNIPMITPVQVFDRSVHIRTPQGQKHPAAICVDCHSSTGTGHKILPPIDPAATIFHFNIPRTCGKCHAEVARAYETGNHGKVAARGEADAPVCTTCHDEHAILPVDDPASPVSPVNVSLTTCGPCHGSDELHHKYGLRTGIMKTWQHSYHGLKSTDGDREVASCASCHDAHRVLPASDPRSSVNQANLSRTCGKCHQGISAAVTRVPIHAKTGIALNATGLVLRNIYIVAIIVIIGLMVIHWQIDVAKHVRNLNRMKQIVRMRGDELWQHTLLMVSFTVLAVTGFAFHYSGSWWAKMLFGWEGGFRARHAIHLTAAFVFMATAIWHAVYLSRSRGRRFMRDIFPRIEDFRQFWQMIAYNLGRRGEAPRFGRFSYIEKAEYWALVWGTVVMTITGLALWFGNVTEKTLQVQAIGIMLVVHFYEAILATLAIVVWHFYSTIFNPPVYPNNPSWYTGRMPESMYFHEHPDDPILREGQEAADRPSGGSGGKDTAEQAP